MAAKAGLSVADFYLLQNLNIKKPWLEYHGFLFQSIKYYFTRETYSPERVSTLITSPI